MSFLALADLSVGDLTWGAIAVAVVGSMVAGFINTLAGNGSAITLTVLTEVLGLPPLVANGTNRVGALAASATSSLTYLRSGRVDWRRGGLLLAVVVLGAIAGGIYSTQVSNAQFRSVFRWMLLLILALVFVRPKAWLAKAPSGESWPKPLLIVAGLAVGFYGGFIQMGFGPLFLALAVLGAGMNLAQANVFKVVVVAIYTPVLLVAYAYAGQVHWVYGALMAVGQAAAAWGTTRFAIESPRAGTVAYVTLIVVVVLAAGRMFLT